jgi:hypothetical protein
MADSSLPVRVSRYPQPAAPPAHASLTEHLKYSRAALRYCIGETRGARVCGLSDRKWLYATRLTAFALNMWRYRMREERLQGSAS